MPAREALTIETLHDGEMSAGRGCSALRWAFDARAVEATGASPSTAPACAANARPTTSSARADAAHRGRDHRSPPGDPAALLDVYGGARVGEPRGDMVPVAFRVAAQRRETDDTWTLELEADGAARRSPRASSTCSTRRLRGGPDLDQRRSRRARAARPHGARRGCRDGGDLRAQPGTVLGVRGPFGDLARGRGRGSRRGDRRGRGRARAGAASILRLFARRERTAGSPCSTAGGRRTQCSTRRARAGARRARGGRDRRHRRPRVARAGRASSRI